MNPLEESNILKLDFSKLEKINNTIKGVIPAIIQDVKTGRVLMLAYVNKEALDYSIKNNIAVFWSTSRNELWVKGKTSGEYLDLKGIYVNCEQNSLLYKVKIRSAGACHTKNKNGIPRKSCYYRKIDKNKLLFTEEDK
ncbi:MAG: phosphoribosyl-AMP cyclohydrolase [Spirochaetia bacterium]|nr:phosphoribosyl-AMP cyclohydrolase [Spirochaetia bacterium]